MNALARISEINYSNAKRNPLAQIRKWFMDYNEARHRGGANGQIGGLLGVKDCLQVTDGEAVTALASEKLVEKFGRENYSIVKGYGQGRLWSMRIEEVD